MSESVLHVYAVADAAPPPGARGLFGAPLRVIGLAGMCAIVSEHERAPEPDEDVLWAHEQVVEELLEEATVLPMRFGTTVSGPDELLAVLQRRKGEFTAALERLRGAVELSVRATLPAVEESGEQPAPEAPASGGTYLLERARQHRRQVESAGRIHEPLAALARRSVSRSGVDPRVFKVAYLVDRGAVDAFAAQVDQLNESIEGAQVSCTGPWPPYSFVAEGENE